MIFIYGYNTLNWTISTDTPEISWTQELLSHHPDVKIIFDHSYCSFEHPHEGSILQNSKEWLNLYSDEWQIDLDLLKPILIKCERDQEKQKVIQVAPWLNGKVTGKHICEKQMHFNTSEDFWENYKISITLNLTLYYSTFISYSSKDEDFARRLYADLQNKGVRCWFAPKEIQGGRKIHEQIGEAIHLHEKLLLVLSEHSMNSEWVKTEIAEARQREVCEKHQVLFPISLVDFETIKQWDYFDADIGKDSAREIREYFIPDFSNWKNHDAYQQAFNHLLRDLKPELERKPEIA